MTTQITPTTELQAVNTMLSMLGESPVSSITGTVGTDIAVAKQILDETSLSIQAQGWYFNREYEITATRDTDDKVPLESNCVAVEASEPYQYMYHYTIRNGYLYDLENHTDVFTADPLIDKVLIQQFEHLPEYARRYITAKAARRFVARYLGSAEVVKIAAMDEQEAHVGFEQADSRAMDANVLKQDYNLNYITNRGYKRSSRS
jgi:hypothetical protein